MTLSSALMMKPPPGVAASVVYVIERYRMMKHEMSIVLDALLILRSSNLIQLGYGAQEFEEFARNVITAYQLA